MTGIVFPTRRINFGSVTRLLSAGWRWWRGEILTMLPAPVARLLVTERDVVLLTVADDGLWVRPPGAERSMLLQPGDAAAMRRADAGRAPHRLALPPSRVLHTRITLPQATEENLAEVLRFELDRRTPFSAEDAVFAYKVTARDRSTKQIEVALAVVPRAMVDVAAARAEVFGFAPDALDLSLTPGAGELLVGLHGENARPRHVGWRIAGVLIPLLLAAAIYPVLHSRHEANVLKGEVASARAAAARTATLEDELSKLNGGADLLLARKQKNPGALRLMADVTHLLPDDTWLEELSIDGKEVRLVGYSAKSSALLPLLARSSLIAEPRFAAAVTTDQASGRERFAITARPTGGAK